MKKMLQKGFTLVELLIVITIIAIMAVGVLVGINPVEQINKAKDSGYVQITGDVMRSAERYYASSENFPWGIANDTQIYRYDNAKSGLTSTGVLYADFKSSSTSQFQKANLYIGHITALQQQFYTCYTPQSLVARAGFTGAGAKYNNADYMYATGCNNATGVCTGLTTPTYGTNCGATTGPWDPTGANQCLLCLVSK